ncbi:hypothetical protein VNO78_27539 [Psophocarpus tetragonolobus]|uniref:Disease resistance protein At4g27190-like leucine-rich repeats domain-containing protein n=1 Tax=Psophocarpus tetragonolobus TaxID=3891 RepID=A0AAN9S3J7_PSOTE
MPKLITIEALRWKGWEQIYGVPVPGCNPNDDFFPRKQDTFLAPYQNICFPNLQTICISYCHKLKTVFSVTSVSSLPNLESLFVDECDNLEVIISLRPPPPQVIFPKLERIWIKRCRKLKSIFFTAILATLPRLKWLTVEDCNELEDIISSEAKAVRNLSNFFQQVYFPTLQEIEISRCNKLKTIFSFTIVRSLTQLECLIVYLCNELEELFSFDSKDAEKVEQILTHSQQVYLPRLYKMHITRCNKLKTIFPLTIIRSLPDLEELCIEHCNALEELFCFDSKKAEQVEQILISSQQAYFPRLVLIDIRGCNKLKFIFSFSVAYHCSSLEKLCIECCSKLERIVKFEHTATSEEGVGAAIDDNYCYHLLFPNLYQVELQKLPSLTQTFPGFEPEFWYIKDCPLIVPATIQVPQL